MEEDRLGEIRRGPRRRSKDTRTRANRHQRPNIPERRMLNAGDKYSHRKLHAVDKDNRILKDMVDPRMP